MKENITKIVKSDSDDVLYIGDNIEISVKDKTISNIVIFIPSDLNIPHVFMIYKIITGCMPGEYATSDLYAFEMFTKLEAYYPCVKDIRRDVSNNPKICPSSITADGNEYGIKITVAYIEYDKRDIYNTAQVYSIGDKRIREAVYKVYGRNWAKALTKELSVIFNEKGDNNMKYPETAYISNDIEIHINKRIIDNITVYIPLYVKAADAVKIYDAITGYGELRPYEMLDDLKKYYPYLKNIDRGEIDNDYIFTEDIGDVIHRSGAVFDPFIKRKSEGIGRKVRVPVFKLQKFRCKHQHHTAHHHNKRQNDGHDRKENMTSLHPRSSILIILR
jgi:hypothetical protein